MAYQNFQRKRTTKLGLYFIFLFVIIVPPEPKEFDIFEEAKKIERMNELEPKKKINLKRSY